MATLFTTDRLELREFTDDDVDALFALDSDPEVTRYTGQEPLTMPEVVPVIIHMVAKYIQDCPGLGIWATTLKHDGTFIGWTSLKHTIALRKATPELLARCQDIEIGYRFLKPYWGNGYATEAARAMLQYGFETVGLSRIVADAMPDNVASLRVMQKSGMTYEARMEEDGLTFDRYFAEKDSWSAP